MSKKKWRGLIAGQVFFAVAAVALAIALGVVVAQHNRENGGQDGGEQETPDRLPFRLPADHDIVAGRDRTLDFVTTETTWTNLDVSPDGSTIVFDLLGELYTMPITGGAATPVGRTYAYNVQPRYSPDGKHLLYKSDLSGCDNLWMLTLATGEAKKVTDEKFRFVGSGAWSPDGTQVAGIKWHTTERSIGAGELWLYSLDSLPSSGRRLVGRASPSTQIGPEEPVFDPSGNFIYYSQNTADAGSGVWQYSKDPQAGIYTIRRVNLTSGAVEDVTGGVGGACRPQLSRDGAQLAFVRRIRFESALVLRDLATGNERVLYTGLSTDQQETSATSGVYPYFAWTPDNSAIIIWSKGQFLRIDVASGEASVIPMQAEVNLRLGETVRPSINAATGSSITAKVLQWPAINGDRSKVFVYAMGYVYSVDLSSGSGAVRVTTSADFEFAPSLSPSGAQLAVATWNDVALGGISIVSSTPSGGPATVKVPVPTGRYALPAFSAAGDRLVFSRRGGDGVSGSTHGLSSGIYVSDLTLDGTTVTAASAPRRVTSGSQATFSADGTYLLVRRGTGTVVAVNAATGAEGAQLTRGDYAIEVAVSPDMKLVAFVELDNVYIAPLHKDAAKSAGDASVDIVTVLSARPQGPTAGVVRVSRDGGRYLRWTADSSRVDYLLGNTLYSVAWADVSGCAAGDEQAYGLECALSKVSSKQLSVTAASRVAADSAVAFVNATVLTMDDANTIIEGGCVVTTGGTITAVGDCADVTIPPAAKVVEMNGGLVLPGFIDAHAHWGGSYDYYVRQSWEMLANLAFGVTTLHNPSYDTIDAFAEAELASTGEKLSPRLYSTGTILYGADGTYRCEINTDEDARSALRRLAAYGAWSAKSYNQPCRSARQRILNAARELGFAVVPEGGMSYTWNLNQIIDGHTTIEHSLPVAPLYNDVLTLFSESGTAYTPTLVVNYGGIWGERFWYQMTNVWENERLRRFHPTRDLEGASMRRVMADPRDYHHFRTAEAVKELHERGTLVQPGAHGQRQGIGFHWELWMLSQGNLSNYEVLRAATRDGATALGIANLGKLTVGAVADIITYAADASPLDLIDNSEKVWHVLMDGHLYDAATLNQLHPAEIPLPEGPPLEVPEVGKDNRHAFCA